MINEDVPRRREWDVPGLYKKAHYLGTAERRSRMEGVPQIEDLDFVNGRPQGVSAVRATAPREDPYARREARNRRQQAEESDEQDPTPVASSLPKDHKIPLVCPDWRLGNNCLYDGVKCRFMHENNDEDGNPYSLGDLNGYIPPKYGRPPLTCLYWLRLGCQKTAQECKFAHENTGWIPSETGDNIPCRIDPDRKPNWESISKVTPSGPAVKALPSAPSTRTQGASMPTTPNEPVPTRSIESTSEVLTYTCWYWKNYGRCKKTAEECSFKHYDTGVVAERFGPRNLTCWFWRNSGSCSKGKSCRYQHYDTGFYSNPPRGQTLKSASRGNHDAMGANGSTELASRDLCNPYSNSPVYAQMEQSVLHTPVEPDARNVHASDPFESGGFDGPVGEPEELNQIEDAPARSLAYSETTCSSLAYPSSEQQRDLRLKIERVCELDFDDMFTVQDALGKPLKLDRRAFIMHDPEEQKEELELISRWLMMQHVEISSAWHDGGWDYFQRKTIAGKTGVVIVSSHLLSSPNVL